MVRPSTRPIEPVGEMHFMVTSSPLMSSFPLASLPFRRMNPVALRHQNSFGRENGDTSSLLLGLEAVFLALWILYQD